MAKDAYYFSHDYNARNDEKILELRSVYGAEGYGLFWMIVETMAENSNGGVKASLIGGLSLGYGVAKARLMQIVGLCVEVGLFYENDGYYFSNRLLAHKKLRKVLSDGGKNGAVKRWKDIKNEDSPPIAPLSPSDSPPIAKESKGKEKKENEIFSLEAIYQKNWDEYKIILNGQANQMSEIIFIKWKEFVDFIRENKFEEIFKAKFVSPIEFGILLTEKKFLPDKWKPTIEKILSTGIMPQHNLFFRIPQFLEYGTNKKPTASSKRDEATDKFIEKGKQFFKHTGGK